jgi:hypothetical protein
MMADGSGTGTGGGSELELSPISIANESKKILPITTAVNQE